MLIYSKNRLVPTSINMMVLEDTEGAYYYVHRSLYEQAVILEDSYGSNLVGLRLMIAGARNRPSADYFYQHAPKPIGILGLYLELVEGEEDFGEDIEMMCGILHVMSSSLNFRNLLKIEARIRASVRFSLSIKEEYQLPWDRFFQEALDYDNVICGSGRKRDSSSESYSSVEEEESEQEEEEDPWAFLNESINFDEIEVPGSDDSKEEDSEEVTVAEPEPEEVAVASGLSRLKGWS